MLFQIQYLDMIVASHLTEDMVGEVKEELLQEGTLPEDITVVQMKDDRPPLENRPFENRNDEDKWLIEDLETFTSKFQDPVDEV